MHITEIYKSLQGESTYAGLPCVFVRLTGCNLRCSWCDCEFTFSGGHKMTGQEVLSEVTRLNPCEAGISARPGPLVEITGGEPMLQEREVIPLMERCSNAGYKVLLETSGERPLDACPSKPVIKIVDVKCPDSGEHPFRRRTSTPSSRHDELKFVLTDRTDYEFARDFIRRHHLDSARSRHPLLRPPSARTPPGRARHIPLPARSTRTRRLDARRQSPRPPQPANPQIHLGPATKGV